MDSDTIWRHVDTERTALADILAGLPDDAWRTPSLCDAWTVRDVAAHLALSHMGMRDMLVAGVRSGFRYQAIVRDSALRSPLDHDQIIDRLRGFVGSRRTVPFVSEQEPLLDVLVHTQDICLPLDIEHTMPPDAAVVALERVLRWSWATASAARSVPWPEVEVGCCVKEPANARPARRTGHRRTAPPR